MTYKEAVHYCKRMQKQYSTGYSFATRFFTKESREAVFVLYAFFRTADEIVDNPHGDESPAHTLSEWKKEWITAYTTGVSENAVLFGMTVVMRRYSIPLELSTIFIDSMIQDTKKNRYATYTELKEYMYGSAAVVGLMLTYIVGYSDSVAFSYAEKLGYAMQLTNFLRDIREDYELRNRIYLPENEMKQFGVSEDDIKNHRITLNFVHLMEMQVGRARQLYKEANFAIPMLSSRARFPIQLASNLYERVLDVVEDNDYNIFSKRARVTTIEKFFIFLNTHAK